MFPMTSSSSSSSSSAPRRYQRRTVPQERPKRRARVGSDTPQESSENAQSTQTPALARQFLEPLQIPLPLDKLWVIETATSVLVDHLLYASGLFPMTVSELLSLPLDAPRRVDASSPLASPSTRRKLQQARSQLSRFTDAWISGSSSSLTSRASFVLITVGASFGRGREHWLLDFRGLMKNNENQTTGRAPPPPAALARRLLPRVVDGDSSGDLLSRNGASSRLFVSIWLSNQEIEEHWKVSNQKDTVVANEGCVQWIPKNNRVLPKIEELRSERGKRPKKRLVVLPISYQSMENTISNDETINFLNETERLGKWLALSQSIKGFRV